MALFIRLSVGGDSLAVLLPAGVVSSLGLVPLSIGIVRLMRGPQADSSHGSPVLMSARFVAGVTVANIALHAPLFSTDTPAGRAIIAAAFFILTGT